MEKTALPYSLAGLPGHLCAPLRVSAGSPLFLPHSALRRLCARGWPRWQLGNGQPSGLAARRFQSGRRQKLRLPSPRIRRAPGRAAWPGLTPELEGCRGLLLQFASAWTPCRPFSLAKESLLNTDIIQNKLYFFCFVSQNVSSKECRTFKTNLAFFAFTDFFFFSFAGCYKPKSLFSKAGSSLVLLHHYHLYKGIIFPFRIKFFSMYANTPLNKRPKKPSEQSGYRISLI